MVLSAIIHLPVTKTTETSYYSRTYKIIVYIDSKYARINKLLIVNLETLSG